MHLIYTQACVIHYVIVLAITIIIILLLGVVTTKSSNQSEISLSVVQFRFFMSFSVHTGVANVIDITAVLTPHPIKHFITLVSYAWFSCIFFLIYGCCSTLYVVLVQAAPPTDIYFYPLFLGLK